MKLYTLERKQVLPISLEEAWGFFSSPANLPKITPPSLNFEIMSRPDASRMYAGQLISYKVNVLPGIRVRWVTEITHVHEPDFFVDEQRSGPYALWHHQHRFTPLRHGVEVTDIVNYAIPLGFAGRLAHALFVKRQLNSIFDYRHSALQKLFSQPGQSATSTLA